MTDSSSSYSYIEIIQAIQNESVKIYIDYPTEGDGRITSSIKEHEYLSLLEKRLKETHPQLEFETQPRERFWWDFRVNKIPFNLKLTTGGTDNAFNKVAIIYSISGIEIKNKNMNYNKFFKILKEYPKKDTRDRMTEYHYLVINKTNGKVLLKSIFDIHSYKSNPSNDLQIDWSNEFKYIDFVIPDANVKEKIQQLIKTIQISVRKAIEGMIEFSNADIDSEFPN
jgi:hypothetical protein